MRCKFCFRTIKSDGGIQVSRYCNERCLLHEAESELSLAQSADARERISQIEGALLKLDPEATIELSSWVAYADRRYYKLGEVRSALIHLKLALERGDTVPNWWDFLEKAIKELRKRPRKENNQ